MERLYKLDTTQTDHGVTVMANSEEEAWQKLLDCALKGIGLRTENESVAKVNNDFRPIERNGETYYIYAPWGLSSTPVRRISEHFDGWYRFHYICDPRVYFLRYFVSDDEIKQGCIKHFVSYNIGGEEWIFAADPMNDVMTIVRDGERHIIRVDDSCRLFEPKKTKLKALGGACGAVQYLKVYPPNYRTLANLWAIKTVSPALLSIMTTEDAKR